MRELELLRSPVTREILNLRYVIIHITLSVQVVQKKKKIHKHFRRGLLNNETFCFFRCCSSRSCFNISSAAGCVCGWWDEVVCQGRSSLFILSPLIPCYPNIHRSSITLGNEWNNFHICLIPTTCLPGLRGAVPSFALAFKPGLVVLCSSRESRKCRIQ